MDARFLSLLDEYIAIQHKKDQLFALMLAELEKSWSEHIIDEACVPTVWEALKKIETNQFKTDEDLRKWYYNEVAKNRKALERKMSHRPPHNTTK